LDNHFNKFNYIAYVICIFLESEVTIGLLQRKGRIGVIHQKCT
jgi:hypothetical protein